MSGKKQRKSQKLGSSRRNNRNRNRDAEDKECDDSFPQAGGEELETEQKEFHIVPEKQAADASLLPQSGQAASTCISQQTSASELHSQTQYLLAQAEAASKKRKMGSTRRNNRGPKDKEMPEEELEDKVEVSEEFVEEHRVTEKVSVKYYDQHSSPGSSTSRSVNPESSTLQMEHRTLGSTIHQDLDELDQLKGSEVQSFDFRFATTTESSLPPHTFDGSSQMDHQMETLLNATGHKRMGSGDRPPEEERFTASEHDFEDVQVSQDPQMPPANPVNVSHDQSTFNPIDKQEKESTLLAHECNAGAEGEVTEVPSASLINEHVQEYSDFPEDGQNSSRDGTEGTQEGTVNEDISDHCLEHRHQTFKITERLQCIQEEILEYREDKEGYEEVHMAGDSEGEDQKMILTPKKKEETSSDLHLSYETGLPYDSSVSENIQPRDEQHDARTLSEESGIEEQDRSQTEQGVKEQNQEEEQDGVRRTEEEEAENDEANLLEKNVIPFATLHEVKSGVISSQAYSSTNDVFGECSSDINIQLKEEACIDLNSDSNQLTDGKIFPDSRLEKEEPLQAIDSTVDKERGNYNNENRNQEFFEEIQPSEKVCDTGAVSVEEDVDNNHYDMISDEPTDLTKKNSLKDMNTEDRMLLVFDNLDGEDKVSTEEVPTTDQLKQTEDVEQSSPEHLQRKEEWTEEEEILKGFSTMAKEDVTKDDAEQTGQENVPQTFSAAPTDDNTSHLLQEQSTAVDCVEVTDDVVTNYARGLHTEVECPITGDSMFNEVEDVRKADDETITTYLMHDENERLKSLCVKPEHEILDVEDDCLLINNKQCRGTDFAATDRLNVVEHQIDTDVLKIQNNSGEVMGAIVQKNESQENMEIEAHAQSQTKKKRKFGSTRRPQGGPSPDTGVEERQWEDVRAKEGTDHDDQNRCSEVTTQQTASSDLLANPQSAVSEVSFDIIDLFSERGTKEGNRQYEMTDIIPNASVCQIDNMALEENSKAEGPEKMTKHSKSVAEAEIFDSSTHTDEQKMPSVITEIRNASTYDASQEASIVCDMAGTDSGSPRQVNASPVCGTMEPISKIHDSLDISVNMENTHEVKSDQIGHLLWDPNISKRHVDQPINRYPEAEQNEITFIHTQEPKHAQKNVMTENSEPNASVKQRGMEPAEGSLTEEFHGGDLKDSIEDANEKEENSVEKDDQDRYEEGKDVYLTDSSNISSSKNDGESEETNEGTSVGPTEDSTTEDEVVHHVDEDMNKEEQSVPSVLEDERGDEPTSTDKQEIQPSFTEIQDDTSTYSMSPQEASVVVKESNIECTETGNPIQVLTSSTCFTMELVSEIQGSLDIPVNTETPHEIASDGTRQLPWERSIPEDHLEQLTNREPEAEQHENSGTLMKNAEPQAENQGKKKRKFGSTRRPQGGHRPDNEKEERKWKDVEATEGIEHDEGERCSKETTHQAATSDMLAEPLSVVGEVSLGILELPLEKEVAESEDETGLTDVVHSDNTLNKVEELVENIEEQFVVDDEKVNKLTEEELVESERSVLEEERGDKSTFTDKQDMPADIMKSVNDASKYHTSPQEATMALEERDVYLTDSSNISSSKNDGESEETKEGTSVGPTEDSTTEDFVVQHLQQHMDPGLSLQTTELGLSTNTPPSAVAKHSDSKKVDGNSKETVEMRNTELQTESQSKKKRKFGSTRRPQGPHRPGNDREERKWKDVGDTEGYEQEEEERCSNETTHQADNAHLLTEQQIAANKETLSVLEPPLENEMAESNNETGLTDKVVHHVDEDMNKEEEQSVPSVLEDERGDEPTSTDKQEIQPSFTEIQDDTSTYSTSPQEASVVVKESNIESTETGNPIQVLSSSTCFTMELVSEIQGSLDIPVNTETPHEIASDGTRQLPWERSTPEDHLEQLTNREPEAEQHENSGTLMKNAEPQAENQGKKKRKFGSTRRPQGGHRPDNEEEERKWKDVEATEGIEHDEGERYSKETSHQAATSDMLAEPLSVVSEVSLGILELPLEKEVAESEDETGLTDVVHSDNTLNKVEELVENIEEQSVVDAEKINKLTEEELVESERSVLEDERGDESTFTDKQDMPADIMKSVNDASKYHTSSQEATMALEERDVYLTDSSNISSSKNDGESEETKEGTSVGATEDSTTEDFVVQHLQQHMDPGLSLQTTELGLSTNTPPSAVAEHSDSKKVDGNSKETVEMRNTELQTESQSKKKRKFGSTRRPQGPHGPDNDREERKWKDVGDTEGYEQEEEERCSNETTHQADNAHLLTEQQIAANKETLSVLEPPLEKEMAESNNKTGLTDKVVHHVDEDMNKEEQSVPSVLEDERGDEPISTDKQEIQPSFTEIQDDTSTYSTSPQEASVVVKESNIESTETGNPIQVLSSSTCFTMELVSEIQGSLDIPVNTETPHEIASDGTRQLPWDRSIPEDHLEQLTNREPEAEQHENSGTLMKNAEPQAENQGKKKRKFGSTRRPQGGRRPDNEGEERKWKDVEATEGIEHDEGERCSKETTHQAAASDMLAEPLSVVGEVSLGILELPLEKEVAESEDETGLTDIVVQYSDNTLNDVEELVENIEEQSVVDDEKVNKLTEEELVESERSVLEEERGDESTFTDKQDMPADIMESVNDASKYHTSPQEATMALEERDMEKSKNGSPSYVHVSPTMEPITEIHDSLDITLNIGDTLEVVPNQMRQLPWDHNISEDHIDQPINRDPEAEPHEITCSFTHTQESKNAQENVMTENSEPNASLKQRGMEPAEGSLTEEFHGGDLKDSIEDANEKEENSVEKDGQDRYEEEKDVYLTDSSNISSSKNDGESEETNEGTSVGPTEDSTTEDFVVQHLQQHMDPGLSLQTTELGLSTNTPPSAVAEHSDSKKEDENSKETVEMRSTELQTESQSKKKRKFGSTRRPHGPHKPDNDREERKWKDVGDTEGYEQEEEERCSNETTHHADTAHSLTEQQIAANKVTLSVLEPPLEKEMTESNNETGLTDKVVHHVDEDMNKEEEQSVPSVLEDERGDEPTSTDKQEIQPSFTEIQDDTSTYSTSPQEASVVVKESNIEGMETGNPIQVLSSSTCFTMELVSEIQGSLDIPVNTETPHEIASDGTRLLPWERSTPEDHLEQLTNREPEAEQHENSGTLMKNAEPQAENQGKKKRKFGSTRRPQGGHRPDNEGEERKWKDVEATEGIKHDEGERCSKETTHQAAASDVLAEPLSVVGEVSLGILELPLEKEVAESKDETGLTDIVVQYSDNTLNEVEELVENIEEQSVVDDEKVNKLTEEELVESERSVLEEERGDESTFTDKQEMPADIMESVSDASKYHTSSQEATMALEERDMEKSKNGSPSYVHVSPTMEPITEIHDSLDITLNIGDTLEVVPNQMRQLPWDHNISEDHLDQPINRDPEAEPHEITCSFTHTQESKNAQENVMTENSEPNASLKQRGMEPAEGSLTEEFHGGDLKDSIEDANEKEENSVEKDGQDRYEEEKDVYLTDSSNISSSKNDGESKETNEGTSVGPTEDSTTEDFVVQHLQQHMDPGLSLQTTELGLSTNTPPSAVAKHSDSKKVDGNSKETVEMRNTELQTENQIKKKRKFGSTRRPQGPHRPDNDREERKWKDVGDTEGYKQEEEESCSNETTHQADIAHLLTEPLMSVVSEMPFSVLEPPLEKEMAESNSETGLTDKVVHHVDKDMNKKEEQSVPSVLEDERGDEPTSTDKQEIQPSFTEIQDDTSTYSTSPQEASVVVEESNIECMETGNPIQVLSSSTCFTMELVSQIQGSLDIPVNTETPHEIASDGTRQLPWERSIPEDHLEQLTNREPEAEQHENSGTLMKNAEPQAENQGKKKRKFGSTRRPQGGHRPDNEGEERKWKDVEATEGIEHDEGERCSKETSHQAASSDMLAEPLSAVSEVSLGILKSPLEKEVAESEDERGECDIIDTPQVILTDTVVQGTDKVHKAEKLEDIIEEHGQTAVEDEKSDESTSTDEQKIPPVIKKIQNDTFTYHDSSQETSLIVEGCGMESTENGGPSQGDASPTCGAVELISEVQDSLDIPVNTVSTPEIVSDQIQHFPSDQSILKNQLGQPANRDSELQQAESTCSLIQDNLKKENSELKTSGKRRKMGSTRRSPREQLHGGDLKEYTEDTNDNKPKTGEQDDEDRNREEKEVHATERANITNRKNDVMEDESEEIKGELKANPTEDPTREDFIAEHSEPLMDSVVSSRTTELGLSTNVQPLPVAEHSDFKVEHGKSKDNIDTENTELQTQSQSRKKKKFGSTRRPQGGRRPDNEEEERKWKDVEPTEGIEQDEEESCSKETSHQAAASDMLAEPLSAVNEVSLGILESPLEKEVAESKDERGECGIIDTPQVILTDFVVPHIDNQVWKAEEHGQTVVEDEKSDESTSTDEQKIPPVITKIQNDTSTYHDSSQEISLIVEGCGMESTENGGPSQGDASPTCGAVELISEVQDSLDIPVNTVSTPEIVSDQIQHLPSDQSILKNQLGQPANRDSELQQAESTPSLVQDNLKKENSDLKTSGKRRKMGSTRRSPRQQLHGGDLKEYTEDTNENKPKTGEQDDEDRNGEEKEVHATERANISNRKNEVMEDESEEIKGELKANPTEDPTREDFIAEHSEPLMDSVVSSRTTELGLSTNVQPSPVAEHSDFKVEHGKSKDNIDTENTELQTQSQSRKKKKFGSTRRPQGGRRPDNEEEERKWKDVEPTEGIEQDEEERCSKETTHYGAFSNLLTEPLSAVSEVSLGFLELPLEKELIKSNDRIEECGITATPHVILTDFVVPHIDNQVWKAEEHGQTVVEDEKSDESTSTDEQKIPPVITKIQNDTSTYHDSSQEISLIVEGCGMESTENGGPSQGDASPTCGAVELISEVQDSLDIPVNTVSTPEIVSDQIQHLPSDQSILKNQLGQPANRDSELQQAESTPSLIQDNLKKENSDLKTSGKRRKMGSTRRSPREQLHGGDLKEYTEDTNENKPKTGEQDDEDRNGEEKEVHATERANITNRKNDIMEDESEEIKGKLKANPTEDPTREDFIAEHSEPLMDSVVSSRTTELGLSTNVQPLPVAEHSDFKVEHGKSKDNIDTENTELQTQSQSRKKKKFGSTRRPQGGRRPDNEEEERKWKDVEPTEGIEQDEEERCSKETTHQGAISDVLTEKPKAVCELSLEVLIEEVKEKESTKEQPLEESAPITEERNSEVERLITAIHTETSHQSMERHSEPSESINIPRPEPEKLDKKKRKMGSTRRNLNGGDAKKAWERGTGDTDPKADTNIATDHDQSEGSLLSEIESELKKSCLSPLNTTALGVLEISLNNTGNSQQDTSEVPEPTAEHSKSSLELPLSQSSQAQPERSSPGRRRKMGSTRKTPRDKHSEELRDESRETEQETPGNSELEMGNSVQIITEDAKGSVDVSAEVQAISQTDKINTEHPLPGGRRKFGSSRKAKGDFEHNQKETQDDQVLTDELTVCDPESMLISQPAFDHETTKPSPANEQVERSAGNEADVSTGTGLVSLDDLRKSALYNGSTESREVIDFDSWNELPAFEVAVYNIVMVGNCNVGKTSFIRRFQSGLFSQDHGSTIGVDTFVQTITLGNRTVKLNIWDTAGQERYYSITRQVFHKAQGLLLMYDITSSESFCAVRNWISQIQERAPADVIMMLLGNKNDRAERKVRLQDGEALARDYNIHFMECSAATGENVSESLKSLAWLLVKQNVRREEEQAILQLKQPQKKSGCC